MLWFNENGHRHNGEKEVDRYRMLGVHRSLIERWRQQYEESSSASESVTEAEREELNRLRAEVKQLRLERDIVASLGRLKITGHFLMN